MHRSPRSHQPAPFDLRPRGKRRSRRGRQCDSQGGPPEKKERARGRACLRPNTGQPRPTSPQPRHLLRRLGRALALPKCYQVWVAAGFLEMEKGCRGCCKWLMFIIEIEVNTSAEKVTQALTPALSLLMLVFELHAACLTSRHSSTASSSHAGGTQLLGTLAHLLA